MNQSRQPEPPKLPVMPLHPMTDRATAEYLTIFHDEPGVGNGSHYYQVCRKSMDEVLLSLSFQHGPLGENSVNGVLTGTLLQILIHHLRGFQSGPYSSRETAVVITKLEEALQWTKQRELERAQRGVLGTAQK